MPHPAAQDLSSTTYDGYYEFGNGGLRAAGIPTILLELGFHDLLCDVTWLNNNRQKVATAIANTIAAWRRPV